MGGKTLKAPMRAVVPALFLSLVVMGCDGHARSSDKGAQTLRASWLHGEWTLWNEPLTTNPYVITHVDFTTTPATGKNAFRSLVNMTVYRTTMIGDKVFRLHDDPINYVGIVGEYRVQVEPDEIDMYIPIPGDDGVVDHERGSSVLMTLRPSADRTQLSGADDMQFVKDQ